MDMEMLPTICMNMAPVVLAPVPAPMAPAPMATSAQPSVAGYYPAVQAQAPTPARLVAFDPMVGRGRSPSRSPGANAADTAAHPPLHCTTAVATGKPAWAACSGNDPLGLADFSVAAAPLTTMSAPLPTVASRRSTVAPQPDGEAWASTAVDVQVLGSATWGSAVFSHSHSFAA